MAKCDYCGTTIIFGGARQGDLRFCNDKCRHNGVLLSVARTVPIELLEQRVVAVHQGACPRCSGSGPVDVHTSHLVWSALVITSWSSSPQLSCRSCGVKAKLKNTLASLLVGWWGFPWGLIVTPVQVARNIIGLFRSPDPSRPSQLLHRLVCLDVAAQLARAASTPPKLPPPLPVE